MYKASSGNLDFFNMGMLELVKFGEDLETIEKKLKVQREDSLVPHNI